MSNVNGAMADALERGRTRYNARFAAARKGGAAVDGDSFLVHLGNAVAPVVEAVHAEMPDRVDGVLNTLFDVSIELFAASLLGPQNKSPAVGEVWAKLLPAVPKLVMRDPKTVVAALSNAAYNLARTHGARPDEWLTTMQPIANQCESVGELLEAGKIAAWRAGMPHYRKGAIAAAKSLRPAIVGELLGVPAEATTAILDQMLADPWLTPSAAAARDKPAALRLVGEIGAFRGFGGEFLRPPSAIASGSSIFITDGDATWQLICDCFGRLLLRHDRAPRPDPPATDVRVTPDGVVQWGPGRASLPQLADVSGFGCDGHTLAVTLHTSHRVFLIARATAAAGAEGARDGG